MADLTAPSDVRKIMEKNDFRIKKRLGQNFLVDANIVDKIINSADLNNQDMVVEIGPGMGVITKAAARRACKVIALEIDESLELILDETLADLKNTEIIYADAMNINIDKLVAERVRGSGSYKIIANLPYYITSPLIMHILENKFNFSIMVIMIQQEVAQRISALPGTKEYGALSVAVQYYTEVKYLFKVPGTVFIPRPEVESAVIRLKKRDTPPVEVPDEGLFFKVVKGAFGQRRKTLLNALGSAFGLPKDDLKEILLVAGIEDSRRGETLSLLEFAKVTQGIYEHKKG
ncbi:MAG: 16S rRNA (adenine(1518)-N(6)/adenine(1519)-N(6))-dimethyltransferase RsmA [Peptococcaceae bacterium]|nr:16S rRNA (adenine(1518)-N(6)/adenine(1519)-N(6))-dimethyltransferase RsmA [Peptococcaceae bacterium]